MSSRTVHGQPLTRRENDVLRYTTQGLTPAHIGRALHISADTVRAHLRRAGRKLGAKTRDHAVQIHAEQAKTSTQ